MRSRVGQAGFADELDVGREGKGTVGATRFKAKQGQPDPKITPLYIPPLLATHEIPRTEDNEDKAFQSLKITTCICFQPFAAYKPAFKNVTTCDKTWNSSAPGQHV